MVWISWDRKRFRDAIRLNLNTILTIQTIDKEDKLTQYIKSYDSTTAK
jgi:hypothetical protein